MKIVVAVDSFKGSLTTLEAGNAICEGVLRVEPSAEVCILPVADGGEGTLETVISGTGGRIDSVRAQDLLGRSMLAPIGYTKNSDAILEMASACGLSLVEPSVDSISRANTFGLGQQLLHALDAGARRIYIGLGGSGTNDGGAGFAQALGYRFYDAQDRLIPNGEISLLTEIKRIDAQKVDARIGRANIIAITDVNNPLLGETGCANVFGWQKGMDKALVDRFDARMQAFAGLIERDLGKTGLNAPGTGAGGGMGMGVVAFAGAELRPGIGTVLDIVGFDEQMENCELVITGEGRLDAQSVRGKVPIGVAQRAAKYHLPTVAVVGSLGAGYREAFAHGLAAVESAVAAPMPLENAIKNAKSMVADAAERLMRAILLGRPV